MAVQGERGTLLLSSDWLLRLRHNPFYDYLEKRALAWIEAGGSQDNTRPRGAVAPTAADATAHH
jgi:hypothetical protein